MWLFSAATTHLLYLMGAVPFVVWGGRIAFASTKARTADGGPTRPGRAATAFLVVMPLVILGWYWLANLNSPAITSDPLADGPGDWQQIGFLVLSPCLGLTAGYLLGWLLARRRA
ncbi:MAG: hypothetical protein KF914_19415 [Rhizobiaceae bacterium]|nr:hypothetical protein [Rhizobiaceae bacterium]